MSCERTCSAPSAAIAGLRDGRIGGRWGRRRRTRANGNVGEELLDVDDRDARSRARRGVSHDDHRLPTVALLARARGVVANQLRDRIVTNATRLDDRRAKPSLPSRRRLRRSSSRTACRADAQRAASRHASSTSGRRDVPGDGRERGPRLRLANERSLGAGVEPLLVRARRERSLKRPRVAVRVAQLAAHDAAAAARLRARRAARRTRGASCDARRRWRRPRSSASSISAEVRLSRVMVGAVRDEHHARRRARGELVAHALPRARQPSTVERQVRAELVPVARKMKQNRCRRRSGACQRAVSPAGQRGPP